MCVLSRVCVKRWMAWVSCRICVESTDIKVRIWPGRVCLSATVCLRVCVCLQSCRCLCASQRKVFAWRRRSEWLRSDREAIQAPWWEKRLRTSLDICNCFAGSHAEIDPRFPSHGHARAQTHMPKLDKSKMIRTPPPENLTCTKQAHGTSGYWILTMKLQRLHSNGGDEVRSWDGNHKLIPLTWQATRPWLPANTALPSSTEVRKTPRERNTRFIINFGSKEYHNRHRTHPICLILFWCDYCMRRQCCNLHVWLHLQRLLSKGARGTSIILCTVLHSL